MKFLIDESIQRRVANLLTEQGHDALHVLTIDLGEAPTTGCWMRRGKTAGSWSPLTPTLVTCSRCQVSPSPVSSSCGDLAAAPKSELR